MSNAKEMVRLAVNALEEKKGNDITILDIQGVSVIADYFVIVSGDSERQTDALSDAVGEALGRAGYLPRAVEGAHSKSWQLLDYNDVIIHIFNREDRLFYDLERIWRDGKRVNKDDL